MKAAGSLRRRFLVPPFSALDSRHAWWQARKTIWQEHCPELPREPDAGGLDPVLAAGLDPVLAEVMICWCSGPGAVVLDPFPRGSGGLVRETVARMSGRRYVGVDFGEQPSEANLETADFIFSCPDLAYYSDIEHPEFLKAYGEIVRQSCALLKPDRFACFVVTDVRDKRGNLFGFPSATIEAFGAAELEYYNAGVWITTTPLLPGHLQQFMTEGKWANCHAHVKGFFKGDAKRAAKACGEVRQ